MEARVLEDRSATMPVYERGLSGSTEKGAASRATQVSLVHKRAAVSGVSFAASPDSDPISLTGVTVVNTIGTFDLGSLHIQDTGLTGILISKNSAWGMPIGATPPLSEEPGNETNRPYADQSFTRDFIGVFGSVITKIGMLSRLQKNWDSHDAPPIEPGADAKAVQLLDMLSKSVSTLIPPLVTPTTVGKLEFLWRVRGKEITVEVGAREHSYDIVDAARDEILAEGSVNRLDEAAFIVRPFLSTK